MRAGWISSTRMRPRCAARASVLFRPVLLVRSILQVSPFAPVSLVAGRVIDGAFRCLALDLSKPRLEKALTRCRAALAAAGVGGARGGRGQGDGGFPAGREGAGGGGSAGGGGAGEPLRGL